MLSNKLHSRLIPYADEISGDHQYAFRRNRETINHVSGIRHILERKWELNETVRHFFIEFKKEYNSVRREMVYKIINQFSKKRA
jgi:hypothetical protein